MAMDIHQRNHVCALICARREAIRQQWPSMAPAEIDRRARLGVCITVTASSMALKRKAARKYVADFIGRSPNTLKMVLQGHRFLPWEPASKLVEMFPELLCVSDVITRVDGVSDVIQLHREDIPEWRERPKRRRGQTAAA